MVFVELLKAIFVHLDGRHILLLFDIDVSNVQPNVTKIGCCFANFGKKDSVEQKDENAKIKETAQKLDNIHKMSS